MKILLKVLSISFLLSAYLLLIGCSDSDSDNDNDNNNEPISSNPEGPVVLGINYVGVTVSDLDQSTALYDEIVDLEMVDERPLSSTPALEALLGRNDIQASTRLMKSVNAQLRFIQFENPSESALNTPRVEINGTGFGHVAFQVDKATQAWERFLATGAEVVGMTTELQQLNPLAPVEYGYARDADQVTFEFEHVDIEALNLETPPENSYRMRHVALATPDFDRTVAFYSILLEQEDPRRLGNLQGEAFDLISGFPETELEMAFFQVRNMELEIAEYVSHPPNIPSEPRPLDALGFNMIVFDVSDLDAARDKLIEAGGTVVSEAAPMDGGMILFGRDLDNNLLGFQKVAADSVFSSQNFEGDGT